VWCGDFSARWLQDIALKLTILLFPANKRAKGLLFEVPY